MIEDATATAEPITTTVPAVAPSAPSDFYDVQIGQQQQQPLVEALVLPVDWHPIAAEVISLPPSAVLISESNSGTS